MKSKRQQQQLPFGFHYIGTSPDFDHVLDTKGDAVHLGYKDGRHGLKNRCAVHVDSVTNREYEASDSFVNAHVVLQTTECDRKCRRAVHSQQCIHFTLTHLATFPDLIAYIYIRAQDRKYWITKILAGPVQ